MLLEKHISDGRPCDLNVVTILSNTVHINRKYYFINCVNLNDAHYEMLELTHQSLVLQTMLFLRECNIEGFNGLG